MVEYWTIAGHFGHHADPDSDFHLVDCSDVSAGQLLGGDPDFRARGNQSECFDSGDAASEFIAVVDAGEFAEPVLISRGLSTALGAERANWRVQRVITVLGDRAIATGAELADGVAGRWHIAGFGGVFRRRDGSIVRDLLGPGEDRCARGGEYAVDGAGHAQRGGEWFVDRESDTARL